MHCKCLLGKVKFPILSLVIIVFSILVYSQEWINKYTYHNDLLPDDIIKFDDGYLVVGSKQLSGDSETLVLKIDEFGDQVWAKSYRSTDRTAQIHSIQKRNDGFVMVGMVNNDPLGFGGTDGWVVLCDRNGNIIREHLYGTTEEDVFRKVRVTNDRGMVLIGNTYSFNNESQDVWIVKLDSDGFLEWEKTCGTENKEEAIDIKEMKDSNGFVFTALLKHYLWVVRLNRSGGTISGMQKLYDFNGYCHKRWDIHEVFSDRGAHDGFIVAGTMYEKPEENKGFALRLKSNLDVVWHTMYGYKESMGKTYVHGLAKSNYNNFILAGWGDDFASTRDPWMFEINDYGNIEWSNMYVEEFPISFVSMAGTLDGYTATGSISTRERSDIIVAKTDLYGKISGCDVFPGPSKAYKLDTDAFKININSKKFHSHHRTLVDSAFNCYFDTKSLCE